MLVTLVWIVFGACRIVYLAVAFIAWSLAELVRFLPRYVLHERLSTRSKLFGQRSAAELRFAYSTPGQAIALSIRSIDHHGWTTVAPATPAGIVGVAGGGAASGGKKRVGTCISHAFFPPAPGASFSAAAAAAAGSAPRQSKRRAPALGFVPPIYAVYPKLQLLLLLAGPLKRIATSLRGTPSTSSSPVAFAASAASSPCASKAPSGPSSLFVPVTAQSASLAAAADAVGSFQFDAPQPFATATTASGFGIHWVNGRVPPTTSGGAVPFLRSGFASAGDLPTAAASAAAPLPATVVVRPSVVLLLCPSNMHGGPQGVLAARYGGLCKALSAVGAQAAARAAAELRQQGAVTSSLASASLPPRGGSSLNVAAAAAAGGALPPPLTNSSLTASTPLATASFARRSTQVFGLQASSVNATNAAAAVRERSNDRWDPSASFHHRSASVAGDLASLAVMATGSATDLLASDTTTTTTQPPTGPLVLPGLEMADWFCAVPNPVDGEAVDMDLLVKHIAVQHGGPRGGAQVLVYAIGYAEGANALFDYAVAKGRESMLDGLVCVSHGFCWEQHRTEVHQDRLVNLVSKVAIIADGLAEAAAANGASVSSPNSFPNTPRYTRDSPEKDDGNGTAAATGGDGNGGGGGGEMQIPAPSAAASATTSAAAAAAAATTGSGGARDGGSSPADDPLAAAGDASAPLSPSAPASPAALFVSAQKCAAERLSRWASTASTEKLRTSRRAFTRSPSNANWDEIIFGSDSSGMGSGGGGGSARDAASIMSPTRAKLRQTSLKMPPVLSPAVPLREQQRQPSLDADAWDATDTPTTTSYPSAAASPADIASRRTAAAARKTATFAAPPRPLAWSCAGAQDAKASVHQRLSLQYRCANSADLLNEIYTPTLIVHSRDDHIVPFAKLPRDGFARNPHIFLCATSRGGHACFVESLAAVMGAVPTVHGGGSEAASVVGASWLETLVVEFCAGVYEHR